MVILPAPDGRYKSKKGEITSSWIFRRHFLKEMVPTEYMGSKYILGGSDLLSKEAEDRKYRKK